MSSLRTGIMHFSVLSLAHCSAQKQLLNVMNKLMNNNQGVNIFTHSQRCPVWISCYCYHRKIDFSKCNLLCGKQICPDHSQPVTNQTSHYLYGLGEKNTNSSYLLLFQSNHWKEHTPRKSQGREVRWWPNRIWGFWTFNSDEEGWLLFQSHCRNNNYLDFQLNCTRRLFVFLTQEVMWH